MSKFIRVTDITDNDKLLFNTKDIKKVYCEVIGDKFVPCFNTKNSTYIISLVGWVTDDVYKDEDRILDSTLNYLNSKEN